MSRIISIVNQKGGVGKTTTSVNLSACLAESGKKVLIVDFDPQGNTTSGLNLDKHSIENSIYELITNDADYNDCICKTVVENLHIIPANINLAGAEVELISRKNREYILKAVLLPLKKIYDFILIDCPPSLNILTLNALCAADTILVPLQCEYYALEGLSQLLNTVELVKKGLNKNLKIEGIVFTMFDARTNLSLEVVEEVKRHIDPSIYTAIIPRSVRLSEAPSHGVPITVYEPKSKGAKSYAYLSELVIRR